MDWLSYEEETDESNDPKYYSSLCKVFSRTNQNLDKINFFENDVFEIYCENNNLSSLPPLPEYLTVLNCSNNELESLPILPNDLEYLNCSGNKITQLPNYPSKLRELTVDIATVLDFSKLTNVDIYLVD